jgi:hypothetical protein
VHNVAREHNVHVFTSTARVHVGLVVAAPRAVLHLRLLWTTNKPVWILMQGRCVRCISRASFNRSPSHAHTHSHLRWPADTGAGAADQEDEPIFEHGLRRNGAVRRLFPGFRCVWVMCINWKVKQAPSWLANRGPKICLKRGLCMRVRANF